LLDLEGDAPAAVQHVRALMFIERFAHAIESRLAQLGQ
jgi:molecular chaperone HscB